MPPAMIALRQRLGVFRDLQGRHVADDRESFLHLRGIADGGFVDDDLGDAALKLARVDSPTTPAAC